MFCQATREIYHIVDDVVCETSQGSVDLIVECLLLCEGRCHSLEVDSGDKDWLLGCGISRLLLLILVTLLYGTGLKRSRVQWPIGVLVNKDLALRWHPH